MQIGAVKSMLVYKKVRSVVSCVMSVCGVYVMIIWRVVYLIVLF